MDELRVPDKSKLPLPMAQAAPPPASIPQVGDFGQLQAAFTQMGEQMKASPKQSSIPINANAFIPDKDSELIGKFVDVLGTAKDIFVEPAEFRLIAIFHSILIVAKLKAKRGDTIMAQKILGMKPFKDMYFNHKQAILEGDLDSWLDCENDVVVEVSFKEKGTGVFPISGYYKKLKDQDTDDKEQEILEYIRKAVVQLEELLFLIFKRQADEASEQKKLQKLIDGYKK